MARTFSGSGQSVDLDTGAFASSAWDWGTVAFIVRKASNGAWATIMSMGVSSTDSLDVEFTSGNQLYYAIDSSPGFTNFANQGSYTSSGWLCVVITKATGTSTPRAHVYDYNAGTWSHNNFHKTVTAGTRTGHTSIFLGRFPGQTTSTLNGDLAIAGMFRHWDPADADIEAAGLHVDVGAWLRAAYLADKAAVWLLDQAATTTNVRDLTGGAANQWGGTLPSIASSSVPILGYGARPVAARRAVATGNSYTDTVDTTATGTMTVVDVAARADTVATTITATTPGSDVASSSDTASTTATGTMTVVDARAMADTAATTATGTMTVTDVAARADTAATTITGTTPSTDVATFVDTASTTGAGTMTVVDVRAMVDTAATTATGTMTVTDVPGGGATHYTDTVDVAATGTMTVVDVRAGADLAATTVTSTVLAGDTSSSSDTAATTITATTPSSDVRSSSDTAATTATGTMTVTGPLAMLETADTLISATATVTAALEGVLSAATVITATVTVSDSHYQPGAVAFVILTSAPLDRWDFATLKQRWQMGPLRGTWAVAEPV